MEICNEVFRKNPDINYGSNRPDYQMAVRNIIHPYL